MFIYYLGAAVSCLSISWLSDGLARKQIGLILLWCCLISQWLYLGAGAADAPKPLLVSDLAFLTMAMMTGYSHRSYVALVVVGLFATSLIFQAMCFLTSQQGGSFYYDGRNAIFGLQLLIGGVAGGWGVWVRFRGGARSASGGLRGALARRSAG